MKKVITDRNTLQRDIDNISSEPQRSPKIKLSYFVPMTSLFVV